MKRSLIITAALLCFATVSFTIFADLNGRWKGVAKGPDGPDGPTLHLTYTFKIDNDKLTGTAQGSSNPYDLSEGSIKGDSLSFAIVVDNGDKIVSKGKYYATGDSIGMDMYFMGSKLHGTFTRFADK
jgi:hypothetical protein